LLDGINLFNLDAQTNKLINMKKIYICAMALGFVSLANAQSNSSTISYRLETAEKVTVKTVNNNDKAPGDVIWMEDFTGGFPAGWTQGGTTNTNSDNWVINSIDVNPTNYPPSQYTDVTPIASTSGGNHMLFVAENATPVSDRDSYFQTTAIPLTGQASVAVRIQSKFRLCCSADAALNLVVSTDPTFPVGATTHTYDVRGGVAINSMSADPLLTSVNITDLVGGLTGDIYLRVHWAGGASHYFWMVDDIAVIENVSNDIVISNGYYGTFNVPYTRIPVDQIQPIDFSAEVENVGADAQTATIITADINGTVFTGTSASTTLNALTLGGVTADTQDSLTVTTQFTPATTVGVSYTATITASSDFTDATPGNNVLSFPPFEVSQFIYAQDDYGVNGIGNGGGEDNNNAGAFEYEAGNYFDIYANATVYGVDIQIGTDAVINEEVDAVLYSVDAATGDFSEVERSPILLLTTAEIGQMYHFVFDNPTAVTAGVTYFAAVHAGGNTEFTHGTSGSSNGPTQAGGTTSLVFYPNMHTPATGGNYYTARTPMVRLSFDPATSVSNVSDNASTFVVYPNPSNGEFNINLSKDMGNTVNLMVKNVVGQVVINKQIAVTGNQIETISLANYDKGVYFLTINNETVKLIVE